MPKAPKVLMSYSFSENDGGGTHVEIRIAKARPADVAFLEHVVEEFGKTIANEMNTLRGLLEGSGQPDEAIGSDALRA
jgi:hypothetical protein